jgi:hypothetical protein
MAASRRHGRARHRGRSGRRRREGGGLVPTAPLAEGRPLVVAKALAGRLLHGRPADLGSGPLRGRGRPTDRRSLAVA